MKDTEVIELLNSMSIDEKIGQLFQGNAPMFGTDGAVTGEFNLEEFDAQALRDMGSVLNIFGKERLREIQRQHLLHNRIPLVFMADVVYGFNTIFPISLAQACSFDPQLIEQIAHTAAVEAAAMGINVTFSPMVDLARDARWGRCAEGYGEDPLLSSDCARAMVRGYQGDDLSAPDTLAACVKHFAAYGATRDGKDYNYVDISERLLRECYLASYKAAVDEGAAMIMSSFNTVNGVPAVINSQLCRDILREEWGFEGVIITDYGSLKGVLDDGAANSPEQAAQLAMRATQDIDMMDNIYSRNLKTLISDGRVSMQELDKAVLRVLTLKNRLGLLDNPYRYLDGELVPADREKSMALARRVVHESSVLLKNEDNALPLDKSSKIAFIGPFTKRDRIFSNWSEFMPCSIAGVTLEQAVNAAYPDNGYLFESGCPLLRMEDFPDKTTPDECYGNEQQHLDAAIKAAAAADTVVLSLGEHNLQYGESRSRSDIRLAEVQRELFEKVYKVNKNIVLLLFSGRPLDISDIACRAKAVLEVWQPGSAGAQAVCDLLFGTAAPTGKLSMSFPRNVGQLPICYSVLPTGHPSDGAPSNMFKTRFIDIRSDALYPFGYGLTYTTFEYGEMRLSADKMDASGSITASVTVTNTGDRDGDETVQLYLRDRYTTLISRPTLELRGYKRVHIKKGGSATVEFEITEPMLRYYDVNMNYISEPGEFYAFIGSSSSDLQQKSFFLTENS